MSHYCVECPRSLNALDIHAVGRPTRDWDIQEVLMYKDAYRSVVHVLVPLCANSARTLARTYSASYVYAIVGRATPLTGLVPSALPPATQAAPPPAPGHALLAMDVKCPGANRIVSAASGHTADTCYALCA